MILYDLTQLLNPRLIGIHCFDNLVKFEGYRAHGMICTEYRQLDDTTAVIKLLLFGGAARKPFTSTFLQVLIRIRLVNVADINLDDKSNVSITSEHVKVKLPQANLFRSTVNQLCTQINQKTKNQPKGNDSRRFHDCKNKMNSGDLILEFTKQRLHSFASNCVHDYNGDQIVIMIGGAIGKFCDCNQSLLFFNCTTNELFIKPNVCNVC